MPYLWEMPYKGANLYENALIEATNKGFQLTKQGVDNLDIIKETISGINGIKYVAPTNNTDKHILLVDISSPDANNCIATCEKKGWVVDRSAPPAPTEENRNTTSINAFVKRFPDEIQHDLRIALQCVSHGKWIDGSNIDTDERKQVAGKIQSALQSNDTSKIAAAIDTVVHAITGGKIKVDESNKGLYNKVDEKNKITAPVEMPSIFETEPDDTMWDDIVITDYGIPLINLGNPVVKKVLASDNPKEDCPADLKQFKTAIHSNKRLQAVFGKGTVFSALGGKITNLLSLGIAAATADAGKRADRIIKELKEKGGMTTHRNPLLVNYDDIMNADPDNEGETVQARPYNRSRGEMLDEISIPTAMLTKFYSCVDPIHSGKLYIDMLGKAGLLESDGTDSEPLLEGPLAGIKNVVTGIAKGDNESSNDVNKPDIKKSGTSGLKEKYIKMLSEKGHPDAYILKPKTANKEVVVISTGSTGQFYHGKVRMVTMKIGDYRAAAFMTPKEIKQYFAV